jgi:hypothetical protein
MDETLIINVLIAAVTGFLFGALFGYGWTPLTPEQREQERIENETDL